jgi:hypothetical protein
MASRDGLAALSLLWCMQQALILFFGQLASRFDQFQAVLVAGTVLTGAWPPVLCAALAARIYANSYAVFPNAWESLYWCAQTDVALLLSLLVQMRRSSTLTIFPDQRADAVHDAIKVMRWQIASWYLSAAFFKINSSFLDHRYSCASPYVAQLLAAYLPSSLSFDELAPLVAFAPAMVLTGEAVLSLALLCCAAGRGGRLMAPLGVGLACLLHFMIAITPPPNNIGAFSVIMVARLPAFVPPDALASALSFPRTGGEAMGIAVTGLVAAVATEAAARATAAGGAGSAASIGDSGQMSIMFFAGLDWSVPTFVLMAGAVLRGLMRADADTHRAAGSTATQPRKPSLTAHFSEVRSSAAARPLHGPYTTTAYGATFAPALILLAWLHGFAGPPLGVQDLGSSNMYGNLRMVAGGSNHYLLPMNTLRLSGPIVRIESCSSRALNALYPGEISSVITPRATELLKRANHSGRQFNFAMGRVLGSWALPPPPSKKFTRYTVPALELRRMLTEARASGDAFELVYTVLEGHAGDETWRSSSKGSRRVRVAEDPAKASAPRRCVVLSEGGAPCTPHDLPNLPAALAWWERALGVFNPNPIVPGMADEMHCFGP